MGGGGQLFVLPRLSHGQRSALGLCCVVLCWTILPNPISTYTRGMAPLEYFCPVTQHSPLPLKWSLDLFFFVSIWNQDIVLKWRSSQQMKCFKFYSKFIFRSVCVYSDSIFVAALQQSAVSRVCLLRKIIYLTYRRHTTSAVSHLVDFDLVTSCKQPQSNRIPNAVSQFWAFFVKCLSPVSCTDLSAVSVTVQHGDCLDWRKYCRNINRL
jgi:hypothetical protein